MVPEINLSPLPRGSIDLDFPIAEVWPVPLLLLEPHPLTLQTCLFRSHMIIHLLKQYLLRANRGPTGFPQRRQTSLLGEPFIRQKERQGKKVTFQCGQFCNGASGQWPGSILLGISQVSPSQRWSWHLMGGSVFSPSNSKGVDSQLCSTKIHLECFLITQFPGSHFQRFCFRRSGIGTRNKHF